MGLTGRGVFKVMCRSSRERSAVTVRSAVWLLAYCQIYPNLAESGSLVTFERFVAFKL